MATRENIVADTTVISNPFYKLKQFEKDFEKFCERYQEKIDSQSKLIDSLKSRIERLEDHILKNKDIKKFEQDFNRFLEIDNKLQMKETEFNDEGQDIKQRETSLQVPLNTSNCVRLHNQFQQIIAQKGILKQRETVPSIISNCERLHNQIQQIITQKEILGFKVRLKHFRILNNTFTVDDFIQYVKTDDFNCLNERLKRLIFHFINETLSNDCYRDNSTVLELSKVKQIHQQIVKKSNILLANSFTTDDIIQFTKTNCFNSLDQNHKNDVNDLINVKLMQEFQGQNISLSQDLNEYIKRDIIPSLPFGINSYAEYENSDWFNTLSDIKQSRVRKLILLEYRSSPQQLKNHKKKQVTFKRSTSASGLVVICADDIVYDRN